MFSLNFKYRKLFLSLFFLIVVSAGIVSAQTNEFTYQGKLNDGATAANGNYDLVFELHATPTGGAPIGARIRLNVPVTNGVFTVKLDFAAAAFNGADRYLEIGVKPAGSPGGYQQLLPRQPITSAPYSFRSLIATNADTATRAEDSLQLGGIAANQFVLTGDSRLSDARNPLPGSDSYIQSRTTQQSGIINFNISGNGILGGTLSANTVNATTQYNIGNNRVLSIAGTDNTFVGWGAGTNNTGQSNSFFGRNAGNANTTSAANSFFGYNAGQNSIGGGPFPGYNSFFGSHAGEDNTIGNGNSFFGYSSGSSNTIGGFNAFFGTQSGVRTTEGYNNAFFGSGTGGMNTTGGENAFFGDNAGDSNVLGSHNTVIGSGADVNSGNLSYATAIGSGAYVSTSNTIALGRSDGSDYVFIPGLLTIPNLAVAGSTNLCRNSFDRVGTCSSSLRYKTDVQSFNGGLNIVKRLRPITFNWKDGGMYDVGFAAEEVEQIEPLLATYNKDGQVEGVKYGQITTVLVNAVKEQQTQIEQQQTQIQKQQEQIQRQQQQIDALKKLVCSQNPNAEICKEKE